MGRLDELDLSLKLSRKEQEDRLEAGYERLTELRLEYGGKMGGTELGPPVCVLFEGWDASGKGGAIKRLVSPLDQRHVRVAQFAAPTATEQRHHFLWRFWPALPGWGGMTVMDRSWYGRVLVERVEGFAPPTSGAARTTRSSSSSVGSPTRAWSWSSSGCTSPRRSSCAGSSAVSASR